MGWRAKRECSSKGHFTCDCSIIHLKTKYHCKHGSHRQGYDLGGQGHSGSSGNLAGKNVQEGVPVAWSLGVDFAFVSVLEQDAEPDRFLWLCRIVSRPNWSTAWRSVYWMTSKRERLSHFWQQNRPANSFQLVLKCCFFFFFFPQQLPHCSLLKAARWPVCCLTTVKGCSMIECSVFESNLLFCCGVHSC